MQARRRSVGSLIDGLRLPRWMSLARTLRVGGGMRQWPPPPASVPPVPRPIYRIWWAWGVLGSVVVLLASITFVARSESAPVPAQVTRTGTLTHPGAPGDGTSPGASPGSSGAAGSGVGSARDVPLGVYAGEGNLFGVAGFGLQTGTLPSFATDYLDKSGGWAVWEAASNIKAWGRTRYHLVIGVPILPGVGTLAQGATGAYDQYFKTLGENLVAYHEADAILRLGWEFNGNWFRWSVGNSADAANFVAFWRQIVTTMRAVPGAKFQFCWNPNAPSPTTYTPDQAYPGDAYVDYIGTDVYDNFWGTPFTSAASWVHQLTQQWGLDWLGAFAAEHNKPVAIPEWSDEYRTDGHGLGDDPNFIDEMAYWFVNNQVAFANVFSYDSSATYRNNLLDGTFPKALAEFKRDFG
ncbi:MAG TPA: glycosyl hydrolase [Acidimicrobiales bacterium]|nr:glycosyl hydrolase [Acidimicrobiales bacterium]